MSFVGTAKIEHHPENGCAPHVVVTEFDGKRIWFAYQTREMAERNLDDIAFWITPQWGRDLQVLRP